MHHASSATAGSGKVCFESWPSKVLWQKSCAFAKIIQRSIPSKSIGSAGYQEFEVHEEAGPQETRVSTRLRQGALNVYSELHQGSALRFMLAYGPMHNKGKLPSAYRA